MTKNFRLGCKASTQSKCDYAQAHSVSIIHALALAGFVPKGDAVVPSHQS